MRYMVLLSISFLLLISGCSSSSSQNGQNSVPSQTGIITTDNNQQALNYINEIRAKGATCAPAATPLRWNNSLAEAANAHVTDMAINNFVKHSGSGTSYDIAGAKDGIQSSFIDRIKYFGFPFVAGNLVGENIARVSIRKTKTNMVMPNFKKAVSNWLQDPPHCEILMNSRFTDVGVAYYKKDSNYYFVMDLGEIK